LKSQTLNFKPQGSSWLTLVVSLAFVTGCVFQAPVDDLAFRTPGTWAEASSGTEGKISTGRLSDFSDAGLKRSVNEALAYNRPRAATSDP